MTETQPIDQQIAVAERRVAELIDRLEALSSLEEEQAEAGRHIGRLAEQSRAAAAGLTDAAGALREASEVIGRSDPASLTASVDALRATVDAALSEVDRKVDGAVERLTREADSRDARVFQEMQARVGSMNERIDSLEETLRELLQELARRRGPLKKVAKSLGRR